MEGKCVIFGHEIIVRYVRREYLDRVSMDVSEGQFVNEMSTMFEHLSNVFRERSEEIDVNSSIESLGCCEKLYR